MVGRSPAPNSATQPPREQSTRTNQSLFQTNPSTVATIPGQGLFGSSIATANTQNTSGSSLFGGASNTRSGSNFDILGTQNQARIRPFSGSSSNGSSSGGPFAQALATGGINPVDQGVRTSGNGLVAPSSSNSLFGTSSGGQNHGKSNKVNKHTHTGGTGGWTYSPKRISTWAGDDINVLPAEIFHAVTAHNKFNKSSFEVREWNCLVTRGT